MSDSLFRGAFSNPLVARQFLSAWLPKVFLDLIDWSSLEVRQVAGINEAKAERREDVVYRVKAAGREVHFYILVEHQLAVPRRMALRVLEYVSELFEEEHREVATELAALLWTFLLQASDLRREEVRRIVEETIPPEEKEHFMSTAEMLKEEGRKEGRAEGRQALCDSVLDLLETRFQTVPPSVREAILRVEDLSQLRNLVHRAAVSALGKDAHSQTKMSGLRGERPPTAWTLFVSLPT